ncbi:MAG: copper amine oxidase N-terminal domain-containing protein [Oscillospiraceae bacterium]|nr:copper amine oxidase N-terminal domain-containing protein [Oscillospiraceae bacterium]
MDMKNLKKYLALLLAVTVIIGAMAPITALASPPSQWQPPETPPEDGLTVAEIMALTVEGVYAALGLDMAGASEMELIGVQDTIERTQGQAALMAGTPLWQIFFFVEGANPPWSSSSDNRTLPRPGDFLFGEGELAVWYMILGGAAIHPEYGLFETDYAYIALVEPEFARRVMDIHMVLRGNVELLEAVAVYEDGTRFYGTTNFFYDGMIVTLAIDNPPQGQAAEIYFSWRLTNGGQGVWAGKFINERGQFATVAPAWMTSASPHTATSRPAATQLLTDYFIFRDGIVPGSIVGLRPGMRVPLPSDMGDPPHPPRDEVAVLMNGIPMTFDVPPRIVDGRTLVPFRTIFEALGATVHWNPATQTVTGSNGTTTIVMPIGSRYPTVNGQVIPLDVPAEIVDGRTLVPLRFVSENFGVTVNWNAETRQVTITS